MKRVLRPTSTTRALFFVVSDLFLSLMTLYMSYELRFNFHIDPKFLGSFWLTFATLAGLKIGFFFLFRVYFIVWRFFGFSEAKNIIKAHLLAYLGFTVIYLLFQEYFTPFPRSVIIIDLFLSLITIGALRISKRMIIENSAQKDIKPTLIIGVNTKTASIIRSAIDGEIPYYPVAIAALHNDKHALNTYISNIRVYGESRLEEVVGQKEIKAAIITGTPNTDELKAIAERLNNMGITEIKQVKILGSQHEKLEDLSIEDLLARHPKDLDIGLISSFVKEKTILITGAGGSIGSEIARQCRNFGAKELILLDNSEYNLYRIGEQIEDAGLKLVSVTDRDALGSVIKNCRPEIVIHAAAYKHVPICEANIEAALFNNIIGTKNVVDLSVAFGADKLVIISTDKAVRPTNIMGATKRVTELYANNVDAKNTEIVAVRFGNVLGSSGSVIPKFKQQIENGGPVTVTHPEITRYFMLIPEACQLVLQAAAIAKGGELFILDMGEPVKIVDLARQMIRLYGKEDEVEIVFSGLRPGEKLYEELLIDESEKKTRYSSIFTTGKTDYPIEKLEKDIEAVLSAEDKVAALKKIVPEFEHRP